MKKGMQVVFVALMICLLALPAFAGQGAAQAKGARLMTMTKSQLKTKVQAKQQIKQQVRDGSCAMTGTDTTDVPTDDTTDTPTDDTVAAQ